MVQRSDIRDIDLSIRFKHGTHTIFLFIESQAPFSEAAEELLEILRSRYPDGLTTSTAPPKQTPLPQSASQIEFAVAKVPTDLSQGWKPLKVRGSDSPVSKGIKDNTVIAFAVRPDDADDDESVEFNVEFPSYEEEEYAEGDEEEQ